MKTSRFTMAVVFPSLLLLHNSLASPPPPPQEPSVHGRYMRPSAYDRYGPKCTTPQCLHHSDRGRDGDRDDKYADDEYKSGGSVVYKPKDDRGIVDDYNPKPKDDYGSTNLGTPHYNRDRSPSNRDDHKANPPSRIDYDSKPSDKDDYDTKPTDAYRPGSPVRIDYNSKPVDRDFRDSNPSFRDEFEPKPSVIDEYTPKPPIRIDYKPRPSVPDDYAAKPVVNDGYKPHGGDDTKPVINEESKPDFRDDDYDTKPLGGDGHRPFVRGDGYNPPVRGDGYKPPVRGDGYKPPVRGDGYGPPVAGDDYRVSVIGDENKPHIRGDGYKPPVRGDGYKPPVRDDGYKPLVRDDGYKPPVRDDGYKPNDGYKPLDKDNGYKSTTKDDDYDTKPVINDGYKPPVRDDGYKPPVRDDGYKPSVRDDGYKPPVRDDGYKPPVIDDGYKPPVRDGYKPPVRDDGYKPPVRDDGYKPPVRDDGYKPPVRDDGYKPPVRDDGYKPPVRDDGYKPPVRDDEFKPPVRDDGYKPSVREDGYKPSVRDDGYKPSVREDGYKPSVRDDGYKPPEKDDEYKPPARDDYNVKPIGDHASRPPVRDNYKPVSGGGYHSGYPIKKDDDYKISVGDDGSSKSDDEYNEEYKGGDDGRPMPIADDSNCICVPYYQCTEGHIVTDGAGIIDARKRPQEDDEEEELPLDGKFNPPSCGPFHVCCNTPETSTVQPYEHRCGVRNPSGINSRILSPSNKGEADFGEWPWQAAVLKIEGTVNIFQCGGVLIDKYHVLTVAHCVFHLYKYNDYPLKVRLGEWDTQTTNEFLAHEDYKVSKIAIHPEFKNTSLWNDVAILRLQDPVLFAPHIDTVCLPKYDESFAGQNCIVTGWGKDSYKGGTFSNVMKEVALQVIDNYGCEEMLRKTRLGRFFQLHEGFVCAGGEHGLDSCKGDGGGPLVCYRKDRSYALAGLVSWGIDCGQPGVPGVYVKMQKYLDWISKTTGVGLEDYWPKR